MRMAPADRVAFVMRDPGRLEVVELAMLLTERTYAVTRALPPDERFGLTAQMRRAAVSIGSNIAEGCGHSSNRSFSRFLQIAIGSLTSSTIRQPSPSAWEWASRVSCRSCGLSPTA
jgi:hypothetical protein